MKQLGPYKGWTTEKSILNTIEQRFAVHEPRWLGLRQELEVYADGKNPYRDVIDKSKLASSPFYFSVSQSLDTNGRHHAFAILALFQHRSADAWLPGLAKYSCYEYWLLRVRHHAQNGRISGPGTSFKFAIACLSHCLFHGWMDQTKALAREILILYAQRRFFDVEGEFAQPLYHWLLRICFDHYGWQFDGWGKGIYGEDQGYLSETVLNDLFTHWRDEDLTPLEDQLIWLCDYYTHRTREANGTEFGNDMLHTRFPAIVLAWFRLREQRGFDPIEEMAKYFDHLLHAWEEAERLGKDVWTPEQQYTRHDWKANLDHYIVCFWLVGLALALGVPDEQWHRLLALIGNEGEDHRLDRIIASRQPGRQVGSSLCHPAPYQRLVDGINAIGQ
jgi:hypothetical protein